jgi:hypothetical protein
MIGCLQTVWHNPPPTNRSFYDNPNISKSSMMGKGCARKNYEQLNIGDPRLSMSMKLCPRLAHEPRSKTTEIVRFYVRLQCPFAFNQGETCRVYDKSTASLRLISFETNPMTGNIACKNYYVIKIRMQSMWKISHKTIFSQSEHRLQEKCVRGFLACPSPW